MNPGADLPRLERRGGLLGWVVWHLLALSALCLVPVQLRLGPLWRIEPALVPFMLGMATAYSASAVALTLATRDGRRIRITTFLWCVFIPSAAFFFQILLFAEQYPRSTLVFYTLASPAALLFSVTAGPLLRSAGSVATFVAVALTIVAGGRTESTAVEERLVASSLYSLDMTFFRGYFGVVEATGGAIESLDSGYLLALADGRLALVTLDPDRGELNAVDLDNAVPLNREGFLQAAASHPEMDKRWFRTTDILLRTVGGRLQLFASHHFWDNSSSCATIRVSSIEAGSAEGLSAAGPWKKVFESTPCLGFKGGANSFGGHLAGGKLAFLDERQLLLTVGDHEFDGVNADRMISQEDATSYGKTILIDVEAGTSRIFTKGHRNPQGLYVNPAGEIWLTEQGPRGGDELNRIVEGANYGWPLVTYGTDYGLPFWPLSLTQGRHDGYEAPVFSWVPSIAVSALTGIEGGPFDLWKGDLVVAALGNRSIWRLRFDGDRVALAEPIPIGERVRDLTVGPDGELVLLTEGYEGLGPADVALLMIRPVTGNAVDDLDGEARDPGVRP
jgi:glucose/arabinose dehydrogenase